MARNILLLRQCLNNFLRAKYRIRKTARKSYGILGRSSKNLVPEVFWLLNNIVA